MSNNSNHAARRVCKKCGETRPISMFHTRRQHRPKNDGTITFYTVHTCKVCENEQNKQRAARRKLKAQNNGE